MASDPNRWLFTKDQIQNSPSRKCGIDYDKELSYRQQAATLIQEMGQKLQVTQLCINTAIVYMHRFYMFHSFTKFHRNAIASCALFLAAKVEEQPRKLEHVLRVAHMLMFRDQPHLDPRSEQYMEQAQELITNENILLQTLGFDVAIDHPHTHVLRCCQLVRASKDMAQASYFMATNSLHLTTMCLQYKPTVVASVCIHLVCKWSNTEIPTSSEGKDWYWYVDKTVMLEQLEQLTAEFLEIFNKCPSRLKRRVMQQPSFSNAVSSTASNTGDAAAHHDSSSQRTKTETSNVPKPGDRVPRPHDQRRDSKPPHPSSTSVSASSAAAAAVPSSSSSAAAAQTAVHRTSQSGYPHPSAVNPHRSSSSHPDKSKQMHRTSSSSSNSTVPRDQPKFPSHSSTGPPPPVQQPPQQQQQLKPVQQPSQKPQYPVQIQSSKPHSAAPPLGGSSAGGTTKSKSLFSPTHGVEQQSQQPKHSTQDLRKPSSSIFPSLLDASSNSGLEQQQQSVQQQHIPSSAMDLGFDANKFFQERDSTWDFMNFDMGPGFSPPNEAIESMLNENKNSSSEFQQQQQQQHQGLSDLLASVSSPPTVGAMISEPTKAPDAAVEVSCQSSIAGQSATVAATAVESQLQQSHEEVHSGSDKKKKKKEKKEKKEKKKKNKERDSDDSKEKKHKHKHKDKDKSKDNQTAAAEEAAADALRSSLKVKIPTSRLKPEQAPAAAAPPSNGDSSRPELKLRISRDKISSGGGGGSGAGGAASSDRDSRKRERTSNSNLPPPSLPPAPKHARMDPSSQQQAGHYSRERNGYVGSNDKVSSNQQPPQPPPYPGGGPPFPPMNQFPPFPPQQPPFYPAFNNYMYPPFPPVPPMNYGGPPSVPPLPRGPPPQAPPPPPPPSA